MIRFGRDNLFGLWAIAGFGLQYGLAGWLWFEWTPFWALAVCWLSAAFGIWGWFSWLDSRSATIFRPLVYQSVLFVHVLAFPAGVLIHAAITWEAAPTGLITGTIAGSVVALGWIVASLLRQFEDLASMDRERLKVMEALAQEIFVIFEQFDRTDLAKEGGRQHDLILAGGLEDDEPQAPPKFWQELAGIKTPERYYHPFITTPSEPVIFNALSSKVHLLATGEIEKVVRFYAAYSELQSYSADFLSTHITDLPAQRRANAQQLLEVRRRAVLLTAYDALLALAEALYTLRPLVTSGKNSALLSEVSR